MGRGEFRILTWIQRRYTPAYGLDIEQVRRRADEDAERD
jgi:hypothetical protein